MSSLPRGIIGSWDVVRSANNRVQHRGTFTILEPRLSELSLRSGACFLSPRFVLWIFFVFSLPSPRTFFLQAKWTQFSSRIVISNRISYPRYCKIYTVGQVSCAFKSKKKKIRKEENQAAFSLWGSPKVCKLQLRNSRVQTKTCHTQQFPNDSPMLPCSNPNQCPSNHQCFSFANHI